MPVRGGSRGKKRSTLHGLSRAKFEIETAAALYRELAVANDRAVAILAAISVEAILREMILDCLPNRKDELTEQLMERDGALATAFSMNYLARALGLIPRDFLADLETIRRIRNVFAHSILLIGFTHPEISKEVMKFQSLYSVGAPKNEFKVEIEDRSQSRERNLFVSTCRYLSLQMLRDGAMNRADINGHLQKMYLFE